MLNASPHSNLAPVPNTGNKLKSNMYDDILSYLAEHYQVQEKFSYNKVRRNFAASPGHSNYQIGGAFGALGRRGLIAQVPNTSDEYYLTDDGAKRAAKRKPKTTMAAAFEDAKAKAEAVFTPKPPVPSVQQHHMETLPETASETPPSPPSVPIPIAPAVSPSETAKAIQRETTTTIAERILELAAAVADMAPDLSKVSSESLMAELNKRLNIKS